MRTLSPKALLEELQQELTSRGITYGEIYFFINPHPEREVWRASRLRPPMDAALYPPELQSSRDYKVRERHSTFFHKVAGVDVSGTEIETINLGHSESDILGRLSNKMEDPDHRWWVPWCTAVTGMEVQKSYTKMAEALMHAIHEKRTGLPWPRGHRNQA